MRDYIKKGIVLFLKIQLAVILTVIITTPILVVIRFITTQRILQELILGIIGVLVELCIFIYMLRNSVIDDGFKKLKDVFRTLTISITLHFLLGLLNGFYAYTAGVGVSSLGVVWGSTIAGEFLKDRRDVPLYTVLILALAMIPLYYGASFIAFKLGISKKEKERLDLHKEINE